MSENVIFTPRLGGLSLAIVTVLAGCSGEGGTDTPSDTPTATQPPATGTATAAPTATMAAPTDTLAPTATLAPTPTMAPTVPPTPTMAPTLPPTPTAVPIPTFSLGRAFPEDGAWAMGTTREFVLLFNEPFPQGFDPKTMITVNVTPEGGSPFALTAVDLTQDSLGMRYSTSLLPDTAYTVQATVNGSVPAAGYTYDGWFTTRLPCGAGFDMASGETRPLTFTTFGDAGQGQLNGLNRGINGVPQDLVAMFEGVDDNAALPVAAFTMVAGNVSPVDDSNGWLDVETGMTASIEGCTVGASGALGCPTAPLVVIPLNTTATDRKELAYIYLRNVSVTGQVAGGGDAALELTSLGLRGVVTESDINYFLDNAGTAVATVLTPIIERGYDTSLGAENALTVELDASPFPFTLNDCSTGG